VATSAEVELGIYKHRGLLQRKWQAEQTRVFLQEQTTLQAETSLPFFLEFQTPHLAVKLSYAEDKVIRHQTLIAAFWPDFLTLHLEVSQQ
jgi:hypothetical protein